MSALDQYPCSHCGHSYEDHRDRPVDRPPMVAGYEKNLMDCVFYMIPDSIPRSLLHQAAMEEAEELYNRRPVGIPWL